MFAKGVETNGKQFLRILCMYQQANELYEHERSERKKTHIQEKNKT